MRSIDDKEISSGGTITFEFHKGNGVNRSSHRTALGKPTPSKWDDAQKWLVGLSRGGDKSQSKSKPRNSNADDRRLIAPVPQKELDYSSEEDVEEGQSRRVEAMATQYDGETKNVDCDESIWRVNKPVENSTLAIRSICVRDMGTEMTPIASQEPSRTATPIRSTTPAVRSPITSGSSTPVRGQNGVQGAKDYQTGLTLRENGGEANSAAGRGSGGNRRNGEDMSSSRVAENSSSDQAQKMNNLETRAMAWDEAERAKYMAR